MLNQPSAEACASASEVLRPEPVNRPIVVPTRAQIVMAMLNKAAEMGDYCPTNPVLMVAIGANSPVTASNAVALLESMGLILVRRYTRGRVVTIVQTGKSTRAASPSARPLGDAKPSRARTADSIAQFADLIADGATVTEAGIACGFHKSTAHRLFNRMCADLGEQAR